jgi:hypothetical protein
MRITGRRGRPARVCPEWCAKNHQCTARNGYPAGQHRSAPLTWTTPYGTFVATRVQTIDGEPRMELRIVAGLDRDEHTARAQAQQLATHVDRAVREILWPDFMPYSPERLDREVIG